MNLERSVELGLAYTLALASAATASLYGLMSATGPYGVVKAVGLFGVAFVGCHGPAWVVKAKQRLGWPGAAFGGVVTAVCLVTTLWGGLGTNASGGASLRAERLATNAKIADDRAELKRLTDRRAAMPAFAPTTPEAVTAAQDAVGAAELARRAECDRRGQHCRMREVAEQSARDTLTAVLAGKAATDRAAELDADAAAVRARIGAAGPAIEADPQASAFSQLTGLSADTAVALNAFWLSLAFELAAMFCMLIAYSQPAAVAQEPRAQSVESPRGRIIAGVKLIETPKLEMPLGDVRRFMLTCMPRAKGEEVTWGAAYARYQRWCAEQSPAFAPLPLAAFGTEFKTVCERAKVRTRQTGAKVYCLDVQLV